MLSESAHSSDVLSGILRRKGEKIVEIHKLRGPIEKIKEAGNLKANYLVWCHNLLLDTYLNGQDIQKWYLRWYVEDYRSAFMCMTAPTPVISAPPVPPSIGMKPLLLVLRP